MSAVFAACARHGLLADELDAPSLSRVAPTEPADAVKTATSITLLRAEGQTETILRGDIEAIGGTGRSLMPEGLEKRISKVEMADLLALLKGAQ